LSQVAAIVARHERLGPNSFEGGELAVSSPDSEQKNESREEETYDYAHYTPSLIALGPSSLAIRNIDRTSFHCIIE
jgi:hypothetical protein